MINEEELYDIAIIGAGPTGLFAAFYAGMRGMSVKLIDSLPQVGGQLSTLYPEKYIYDVAGFPGVKAQKLVDDLAEQAYAFDPTVVLEETVQEIDKDADGRFELSTNEKTHYAKTVVVTGGIGAFEPRRLKMEEAREFEGKNLHYFIDDLQAFSGHNVLISGGGDSALDWALMLEPIAKNVTVAHRREKFRAHEHSVEQLFQSGMSVKTPTEISKFESQDGKIKKAVLKDIQSEEEENLDVDSVIVNHGFISSIGPIKEWGLDLQKNSIVVNSRMETNIEGLYAAGDICTYDGKVKLIATGFGEAPIAVNNAKHLIDPKAKVQPQHSTSLFS
ncbi:NAD(P)/FAD-dependent oxidoreductase [Salibacterium qingdaonense]|uniref:Ferredoxin--NADP reductase n=1 Tax=Salibacterium qingdaonense TaxID=266892 RepID=A0A1I4P6A9_9BACI|nr:NAD(P)/FAD-dependent oxidoreductase [Salibacterium qingdaonense]SFM23384.1 thioredoxin reductase (NADPH) [Salibacterium qingdaonense]